MTYGDKNVSAGCVCRSNDEHIFARQFFLNGNVKKNVAQMTVNGCLASEDKLESALITNLDTSPRVNIITRVLFLPS